MDRIVDRLFKRLAAVYGEAWERSFGTVPMADIRTVWAHEMQVFAHSLGRIAWALDNLPERCVNVVQFKSLCMVAPVVEAVELPGPAADPLRVAIELEKLRVTVGPHDHKAWAKALKSRHEAGDKLNMNQVRCYKNALGLHAGGAQL